MRPIKIFLICAIFFIPLCAVSENCGVYGQIYSIIEPDFLSFIKNRITQYQENGKLLKMQKDFQKKAQASILNPKPVSGVIDVKKGDQAISFDYKPVITLQNNIVDQNGRVIFYKGMTINPLDQESIAKISPNFIAPKFQETLFFLNAKNQAEVNYTKEKVIALLKENPTAIYKIILINGNLKTASQDLGRIYFDQGGVLCHQFSIKRVPAIVEKDSKNPASLKITEPLI